MLRFVVALQAEARPLVERFGMEPAGEGPFPCYRGEGSWLIVSGPGKAAAAAATAYLHLSAGGAPGRAWLNVGLGGHSQRLLGEGVVADKISDAASGASWYPQLVIDSPSPTVPVLTVERVEEEYSPPWVYESEAAGFFPTACRFSVAELVHCYKVVSDNPDSTLAHRRSSGSIEGLIGRRLDEVEAFARGLADLDGSSRGWPPIRPGMPRPCGGGLSRPPSSAGSGACSSGSPCSTRRVPPPSTRSTGSPAPATAGRCCAPWTAACPPSPSGCPRQEVSPPMIYVEEEILNHPRTLQIQGRFPDAEIVPCSRYGEIFNRRAQHFRLQKRRPSLILAKKHRNFVHEAPGGYGIEGARNLVFSHMHNCIYDCRYCFLQGMYRSAHYVVFVNYEDFQWALEERVRASPGETVWFFSGYECDSLALEPVTRFAASFVPFFARFPQA